MKIEFDTIEELQALIEYLGSLSAANIASENDVKKAKSRSEINHQNYERRKAKQSEKSEKSENNVIQTEEEREKENEKENKEKERSKEKEIKEKVKEKEKEEEIYIAAAAEIAPADKKPQKHRHGNFQHVLLTDEELTRIQADFPDWPDRIQRLDDYLENTPSKHYANHNLTIRNWANKDAAEAQKQPKQIPKEKTFRDLRIEMENQAAAIGPADDFIDSFWRS